MSYEEEDFGFSMPLSAPFYEEPPYDYDAEFVQAYYLVDPEKLERLVSEPLEPADGEIFLLRVIPGPDGKEPAEKRLVSLRLGSGGGRETSELKGGETSLILRRSDQDPTYLLQPQRMLGGISGKSRFSLPYGRTVEVLG
jgi:hypothetical protein